MKLKTTIVAAMVLLGALAIQAQDQSADAPQFGWKKEAVGNLNFTQNNFDNWKQGGENSWSWQLDLNGKFVNDQAKYSWSNSGKISYGMTKVGKTSARKSADEIKLESVYAYKLNVYINPFVALGGWTQLTEGYNYAETPKDTVSDFMNPGYLTQSIGLGYQPNTYIKTRLGAAAKETFTNTSKYAHLYGDGKKTRIEYGAESVTDASFKLAENILFTSKLEMFSNLQALNKVDINWDNVFNSKITKYIAVSFNVRLFYDRDLSDRRQLKETLAVGITYAFL
jgi:hypothetical protein